MYAPDQHVIELKSWKLYLNRYRDDYVFHEAVTNKLLDDFVSSIHPRGAEITADWNVRGNLKTVVRATYEVGQIETQAQRPAE
jgi:7-cyano-7-deazaguanine reductase